MSGEDPGTPDGASPPGEPDFGPSGYLPRRAAARARKIVLRAPLGIQWVIASIVAGVVVVVAGIVFLTTAGDPPAAPFEPVGPVAELGPSERLEDPPALVVTVTGRIRAFVVPEDTELRYCPASRRLESADGGVWSLTGRGYDDRPSLEEYETIVHDGTLYLDPTRTVPAPPPTSDPPPRRRCDER